MMIKTYTHMAVIALASKPGCYRWEQLGQSCVCMSESGM